MLPQFGFIVAQAGADSIQATSNVQPPQTQQSSSQTKPSQTNEFPYYTRHSSPVSTPMLPPPVPYMREYYPFDNYRPLQPLPPPVAPALPLPPVAPAPPPPQQPQQHNGNYNNAIDSYNNHVWPPFQPIPNTTTLVAQSNSHSHHRDEYVYEDPPYQTQYNSWQEEPMELNENKMLRRVREFNDLMTWMDSEFWEQCDEIYREKIESLQEEIQLIQDGTHSAFKDTLADIEQNREQTIEYAEYFRQYEFSVTMDQYQQEKAILLDEYENERHNLHDVVLQSIEEKRKQVKEDKEDNEFDVKELFRDAYSKVKNKRSLRKRNQFDRLGSASPSRQERRRHNRQSTPHNIHATPTTAEEEELESEFMNMKGGLPPRRPGVFTQTRR